jgi:putative SOS response-associated peptidase YedK
MCGRYNLELTDRFAGRFRVSDRLPINLKSRYNIAPSQNLPAIVSRGSNKMEIMKWGLIPFWSNDGKGVVINARSESVDVKPMFKKLLQFRRCLIPATGFYEWKKNSDGKIPYHIRLKNHDYFAFAGLYDVWKNPKGEEIKTYIIITTYSNKLMRSIHNRMPAILKKENENRWLDPDKTEPDKLTPFLKPYPPNLMEAYPISSKINNPIYDSDDLIKIV